MALPVVKFNAGSGSDSAASGAGPSTALSGTGASLNASTTVTLSADTPDLSGVATDGSAVLWVDTTSGRQFSKITAVDNAADTVTVAVAYGVTESGRNWGIGGKRATLDHADSRTLFADGAAGWVVELEDNQTITSAISPTIGGTNVDGQFVVRSNTPGTRRTITTTANAAIFSMASANNFRWTFKDIHAAGTNASKTATYFISMASSSAVGSNFVFINCSCSSTNPLQSFLFRSSTAIPLMTFIKCDIAGCVGIGINIVSGSQDLDFYACAIRDNGSHGVNYDSGLGFHFDSCIISNNVGDGLRFPAAGTWGSNPKAIINCTIYNNDDGVDLSAIVGAANNLIFANNIIAENTVGVRGLSTQEGVVAMNDYNNYYNNSTDRTSWGTGTNDTTLDPQFTNAAGNDFSVGTNMKEIGYPTTAIF